MEQVEYTMYPPDFELASTMSIAASISSYKWKMTMSQVSQKQLGNTNMWNGGYKINIT